MIEDRDPLDFRFLNSEVPAPAGPQQFEALGHAGSQHYVGLETFPNPGCEVVEYYSDEVTGKCPITGQPDFYECLIKIRNTEKCIESKSLKLWFQNLAEASYTRDFGIFCEALAVHIRDQIGEILGIEQGEITDHVHVILTQKSRGGISITSHA